MNIQKIKHNYIISFKKNNQIKLPEQQPEKVELGIDISSKAEYPINKLSNFAKTQFYLDGIKISSMEGFLQSLKTSDIDLQKEICSMVAGKAKGTGKKLNDKGVYDFMHVYWNGKQYDRNSQEYFDLLKRAYQARYIADAEFQYALRSTEGRVLRHSIGSKSPQYSILTEEEFVNILTELRENNK